MRPALDAWEARDKDPGGPWADGLPGVSQRRGELVEDYDKKASTVGLKRTVPRRNRSII